MAKLFIGQIPAVCTEDMLRPFFDPFGYVLELTIMRDPQGKSRGCAWVRYSTREMGQAAIDALHDKRTIPPQTNTLQARFAETNDDQSSTLFVGNLPENSTPESVVRDCSNWKVLIAPTAVKVPPRKRFAFISFSTPDQARDAAEKLRSAMVSGQLLRVEFAASSDAHPPSSTGRRDALPAAVAAAAQS